jgi:hypothetical protein
VAPEFNQTRAELDAAIAAMADGYTPADKATGRLDAFAPAEFVVARGTCYVGAIILEQGAAFGEHARHGVSAETTLPGEGSTSHAGVVHGPGVVFSVGCPAEAGTASADLIADWGSAMDQRGIHELGTGGYTWQLYVKPISEEQLATMKAEQRAAEQQASEQRAFAEERRERDRRERETAKPRDATRDRNRARSAEPAVVSVTLRNSCRQTVKVFYGAKPKYGSGTESTLGGNSVQNHSVRPGDMLWLLDASGNGIASATAAPGMREIEVTTSCTGLSAR